MRARIISATVLLALLSGADISLAQRRAPTKPETGRFGDPTSIARVYQSYLYGVIKTVGPEEMVLTKTKFGVDQTFKLNEKTKYIRDGKKSSHDTLKAGDQVWVDTKKDKKTGDLIAKKVVTGIAFTEGP
jgi:hypothetical protein